MKAQAAKRQEMKIVNGVNVSNLIETIRAIRQQPELADFKFRAKNTWLGGGHNRAEVNSYDGVCRTLTRSESFTFDADEPPVLLGEDQGANPVEILLSALSGCMTTALVYHAASQGIEVEAVESQYEGDIDLHGFLDLDPDVRKGYSEIRVNFKVKSDADAEKLEELARKSPVFDVVTNGTKVVLNVEKQ